MKIETALHYVPSKRSTLFLGAGFSRGAVSEVGLSVPSGDALAEVFCEKGKITHKLSLELASREYLKNATAERRHEYVSLMKDRFRVGSVTEAQRNIVAANWKAIYTTNYDNSVELIEKSQKIGLRQISRYSPFKYYDAAIPIVHLHGYIDDLNEDNYLDCLVIDKNQILSHNTDHVHWKHLEMDLLRSASVFLVGFAVRDLHIEKYLYGATREEKKCFFILAESDMDDANLRYQCEEFGTILYEGSESFSLKVPHAFPQAKKISTPNFIKAVSYDSVATIQPVAAVERLCLFGTVDSEVIVSNEQAETPFIFGNESIESVSGDIANGIYPRILVHSEMGNGKTVLLEAVKRSLCSLGLTVLELQDSISDVEPLARFLRDVDGTVVLVIDNSDITLLQLIHLVDALDGRDVRLLYSCRSAYYELAPAERAAIATRFDVRKLGPVGSNEFPAVDRAYKKYGLWGDLGSARLDQRKDYFFKRCKAEFRSLALGHFHQVGLAAKVRGEIRKIKEISGVEPAFLVALILSVIGHDPKVFLVSKFISDYSYKQSTFHFQYGNLNIIYLRDGRFFVPSSIFAREILERFVDNDRLVDAVEDVFIRSTESGYHEYRQIRRELMQFGTLQRLFGVNDHKDNIRFVLDLMRRYADSGVEEDNIHFWHQYSIALYVNGDYSSSQHRLNHARSKIGSKSNYDEYMLDHHQARLWLVSRQNSAEDYDDHYDRLIDAIEVTMRLVSDPERAFDRDPFNLPQHILEYCTSKAFSRVGGKGELGVVLKALGAAIGKRKSNSDVPTVLIQRATTNCQKALEHINAFDFSQTAN